MAGTADRQSGTSHRWARHWQQLSTGSARASRRCCPLAPAVPVVLLFVLDTHHAPSLLSLSPSLAAHRCSRRRAETPRRPNAASRTPTAPAITHPSIIISLARRAVRSSSPSLNPLNISRAPAASAHLSRLLPSFPLLPTSLPSHAPPTPLPRPLMSSLTSGPRSSSRPKPGITATTANDPSSPTKQAQAE